MSHRVAMATAPRDVSSINDAQRARRGIGSGLIGTDWDRPTLYEPLKSRLAPLEGVLSDRGANHLVPFVSAFRRRGPGDAPMARSTALRAWCVKSGVTGRWSVPRMT